MIRYPRLWLTLLYALLGVGFGAAGLGATWLVRFVLGWMCIACFVVAAGYAFNRPGVFGKRRDGSVSHVVALPVLPVLLVLRVVWWIRSRLTSESPFDRVSPGLLVGRRLSADDALPKDVDFVIDLTCEFAKLDVVVACGTYRTIRTLDGLAPPGHDDRDDVFGEAAAHQGTVFVHCAFGHGRAVAAAAAIMVMRGVADNADDAFAKIRAVRPGIFPSGSHHRFVRHLTA